MLVGGLEHTIVTRCPTFMLSSEFRMLVDQEIEDARSAWHNKILNAR